MTVLLIVVLLSLAASLYFLYLNIITCENQECFNRARIDCRRSYFVSESPDTTLAYTINGKSGDSCAINVKIIQIKRGSAELATLEGKDMNCNSEYGVLVAPEKNLEDCHGILKEDIQNIIIKRLHSQIVQNLGQISEEATKII